MKPGKILIIQTAFIGDVILSTALIEKLVAYHPEAELDFLLRKGNEGLMEDHPNIRKLLIWDKKRHKFRNLVKMIRRIRKEKYDLLINLQRFGSTGLMSWLSGAKEKVGFTKNPFSFCYDVKVVHRIGGGVHEAERNQALIERWTDTQSARPKLHISPTVELEVASLKLTPYLTIAPASVWFTKQFPEEKWVDFLRELSFSGNIYLLGGKEDRALSQRIIDAAGKGKNLCGKLSLMASAALIRNARMNYVNDSAPMHLASAVNAPVCAVFCSTVPGFGFGPLSDRSFVMETREELSCRPCGLHGKRTCPERHFKCGKTIETKALTQLVDE